ncbi:MAG TPA: hypothetical protein VFP72_05375 [Kineosporiaceae bacterium]|nr:hypothetical protein [Kineosporiaceae bacterium]
MGPRVGDRGRVAGPRAVGVAVAAAGGLVLFLGLGRPAYWLDEATTVVLVRRGWPALVRVILHTDAPLGPYYLLMKPWLAVSSAQWWVRLPSALPMAFAAGLVAAWAARRCSTATGIATGAAMVVLPSFTRYGQEVRPYGLMVLAVTACCLAWWRWLESGGQADAARYAVSVAVLPLVHLLALTVVVAQVAAAALIGSRPQDGDPDRRRRGPRTALRTAGLAGLAVLPVSPFLVLAQARSAGIAHPLPLTAGNWWTTFTGIFGDQPGAAAAPGHGGGRGHRPAGARTGRDGLPRQREYRTATGHGQGDARAAVALLDSPGLRRDPVVVLPPLAQLLALAYDPHLRERMPLAQDPVPTGRIVLADVTTAEATRRLSAVPRLVVLELTGSPGTACTAAASRPGLAGYRVTSTTVLPGWCLAVLDR